MYSQAGRVTNVYQGIEGAATPRYAKDITYWASGSEKSLTLGNDVLEETTINGWQQMTGRTAKKGGTQLWGIAVGYGTASQNNGNPRSHTTTVGTSVVTQGFTYDAVNRLKTVTDPLGTQTFAYDRWGNRALVTGSYMAPGYTGGIC
ncbi:MAG: RHS repeat domain-containing protein [Bryobacteraceae bacterium]